MGARDIGMLAGYVVDDIKTPNNVFLRGLWFGPRKPKHVIIWIHGLGSSAFSRLSLYPHLIGRDTAVFAFNNRGTERVCEVKRMVGKKVTWIRGGSSQEDFKDCVDDIEGAVRYARNRGVKNIYLAGHSTGCQKSVYWASKVKGGKAVKGIILLAPLSDYAAEVFRTGKKKLSAIEKKARALIAKGKKGAFLVDGLPHQLNTAQRFISLYSATSAEEIFTYWDPKRKPRALQSVRVPILVLLAEADEYQDRPAKDMLGWFDSAIQTPHTVRVIPTVGHSFRGGENAVAKEIRKFVASQER